MYCQTFDYRYTVVLGDTLNCIVISVIKMFVIVLLLVSLKCFVLKKFCHENSLRDWHGNRNWHGNDYGNTDVSGLVYSRWNRYQVPRLSTANTFTDMLLLHM